MRRPLAMTVVLVISACGSSPPRSEAPEAPPVFEAVPPPPPLSIDGQIDRADLLAVLEAGLGRFLQGVEIDPVREDGRFVGFRLLSIWPDDERFAGIDLEEGDIVLRVNGQPIERPEQAMRLWNGLRVASELVIEFLRSGERGETRFEIVDLSASE